MSQSNYLIQTWSRDIQGQETFIAPSADNETHNNYDTAVSNHYPSLSAISHRNWAVERWNGDLYTYKLPVNVIVRLPHIYIYIYIYIKFWKTKINKKGVIAKNRAKNATVAI